MWKSLLFNFALFYGVTYLGEKNSISPIALAVLFAVLHHVLGRFLRITEGFDYMPNSKTIPPCPPNSERAHNGADCKAKGDRYGL